MAKGIENRARSPPAVFDFATSQIQKHGGTKMYYDLVESGKRIKALRKEHGLTQEQLAEQLGVAANTIARIETGNRGISIDLAIELVVRFETTSMDRIFMDEYYEHLRADNIEAFSKERNDEYVGRAEEYKAAKSALLEGLGLEHLFDHSHELTPKEKEIWMLFDRVDVAELLARDAFAKGAYMLGAEDREIMLK